MEVFSCSSELSFFVFQTTLLFYLSSNVSAKEKENSLSIMQSMVNEGLCKDLNMSELIFHLLKIKNEKKPTARGMWTNTHFLSMMCALSNDNSLTKNLILYIAVLQLTYELMGLIAKEYPDSLIDDYDTQIRDLYFQTLETTLLNQQEVRIHLIFF